VNPFRGRRRRRPDHAADSPAELVEPGEAAEDAAGAAAGDTAEDTDSVPAERSVGPWDVSEVADPAIGRVDLGGLMVPGLEGMELRVDVEDEQVVAATVVLGESALQVQSFAAPRSEGLWEEIRREIAAGITQQGGLAGEAQGPFGPELVAQVPVQLPDGSPAVQPARFLGFDGPRWFLRGVLTGRGAVEPASAAGLELVFGQTVVVRGASPMAPRDPIPLRLPQEPPPGAAQEGVTAGDRDAQEELEAYDSEVEEEVEEGDASSDPLEPFRRGPEITETR